MPDIGDQVLIRVGQSTVTVREFYEALNSSPASPSVLRGDDEALRNERYQTLQRLAGELLILERARDLGIRVSDEELAATVNDFKKDFPDDTFEKTLLENGVSYLSWEKGLKQRLLMEKVIRSEVIKGAFPAPLPFNEATSARLNPDLQIQFPLENQNPDEQEAVDSETGEVENFPDEEASENGEPGAEEASSQEPPEEKAAEFSETGAPVPENDAELKYDQWADRLKEQYTIEIDWKLWEKIEIGDAEDA